MGEPDTRHGVIDRIVGDRAVVIGADEAEHLVPVTALPDGAREGSWLLMRSSGDRVTVLGLDPEGEQRQHADVDARLARLRRERSSARRFDR